MPKTLEGTRRSFPKEDVLLEHIASTYFAKKSRPKTKSKKKSPSLKDAALVTVAVGAIAAAVGFILIVTSITGDNYNEFLRNKISALQVIPLFNNGIVNKDIVKTLELSGYARQVRSKADSKADKEVLVFRTPRKYNWADIILPFRFPVDLSSRTLGFSARGARGGEKITIVLKDSSNRSLRLKELYLSSGWREESIPLGQLKSYINIASIRSVRIEYGRVGESSSEKDSPIESIIYIKDLTLSKGDIRS